MPERMTTCRPREDHSPAIMDWGRVSRAEMIERYRAHYRWQADEAARALALSDDDLIVETHLGVNVRRSVEEVRDA